MKKNLLLSVFAAAAVLVSCKKEVTITPATDIQEERSAAAINSKISEDLPENIREFVSQFYDQKDIASYEIKNVPLKGKSYELKFKHGAEIEFNESGTWHEWSDSKGIPHSALPENIKNYLNQHYPNIFATSIDKGANKIKVDLASDVDLEFDVHGNFIRIDD